MTRKPRDHVVQAVSRLLLATGLVLAVGAAGLSTLGAYQTASYRQAGVREPWRPDPGETLAAPDAAPPAMADAARADPPHLEEPAAHTAASVAPAPTAPTALGPTEPPPGPPTRVRIPSIGVDSSVIGLGITDLGEWELPNEEVGWYRHTAHPGQIGNTVLVGHLNNTWGLPRVFARLRDVRPGDVVEVDVAPAAPVGGAPPPPVPTLRRRYTVTDSRLVASTALDVMDWTNDARLTLFTCSGTWHPIGGYSHRHLVVAWPIGEAAPRSSTMPAGLASPRIAA